MDLLRKIKNKLSGLKNFCLRFFILPDYLLFIKTGNRRFSAKWRDFYPQLGEKTKETAFDRHYVYHTAWAARKLKEISPDFHVDIGSSLFFATISSAFVPVKFYDFRPPELKLSNLEVRHGDLSKLPFQDNSVKSISCLHTVEHVGLGRYGDPIDPEGDIKAAKELERVLAPGGSLLFVVPVGKPKIMFNAHRIYSLEMVKDLFPGLKLKEFTLIPEKKGDPIKDAPAERVSEEKYGCGCFWFIK
jgi:SAM-dependent methyltransferase